MDLKYLFIAIFDDGSRVTQTPEDVSATDEARSAFYDVVQKGLDHVVWFAMYEPDGGPAQWSVNLATGQFSCNGVHFSVGTPFGGKRELVYHRRHVHTITPGGGETHSVYYVFGWQPKGGGEQHLVELS